MRAYLIAFSIAAMLAAASATFARAENGPVCDAYVNEALKGALEVRKLACFDPTGLRNNRWSFTVDHRRWCLTHTAEEVANERAERAKELDHCSYCRDYAHAAYLAAKFNQDHACGFSGPRWDTEEQHHFDWCMGLASDTAYMIIVVVPVETLADNYGEQKLSAEEDARNEGVGQCTATKHIDQALTPAPSLRPKVSISRSKVFVPAPKERGVANDPCPPGAARTVGGPCGSGSTSKVLGSGLLENDQGSSSQGPAATGAPAGGGGGAAARNPMLNTGPR